MDEAEVRVGGRSGMRRDDFPDTVGVLEEGFGATVRVHIDHRWKDKRGGNVNVGTRVEHRVGVDCGGDSLEQPPAVTTMAILFAPESCGCGLHEPSVDVRLA